MTYSKFFKKPNKKGNTFLEILTVMAVLFLLGIAIPIIKILVTELNTDIQADDTLPNASKEPIAQYDAIYNNLWDNAFLSIFIGYTIGIIIASFFTDTHPIFFIISIISYPFILGLSMLMSNAHEEIIADIGSVAAGFPVANFVWSIFPYYTVILFGIVVVILYGKRG